MKTHTAIKILGLLFFLFLTPSAYAGFIVDHTHTDLSQIPDAWISKAKSEIHGAYNHTSHGSQLITGMDALESFPSFGDTYAWSDTSLGNTDSLSLDNYGIAGESDLSQGDEDSDGDGIADWAEDTYTFLKNTDNNHVNVIMWSWCNISGHDIPRYLNSMEWLIGLFSEGGSDARASSYPVQFVFMTAHANGGGEGDSSDLPNEQIRAHVLANDRILFDFSDIENYDPDNNYYLDKAIDDALYYDSNADGSKDANWASEFLIRHNDGELDKLTTGDNVTGYDGSGYCSHSPEGGETSDAKLNCILKGRAVWFLFARLSGWDGTSRWAKHAGGNYTGLCNSDDGESGKDIVVDAQGNSYVVGIFRESADIFGTPLVSGGWYDTFLTKFDKDGTALWTKHATSSGHVNSPSVAQDSHGNIFVTGTFSDSATLFGMEMNSTGNYDGYLAKLTTEGTLLWVKKFGGTEVEESSSIFIDIHDNIYIAGAFNSPSADSDLFGTDFRSSGYRDAFVAKLDSNGNGIWTKIAYSNEDDKILDVAVDAHGNVYVTGFFSTTADIFGTSLTAGGPDGWYDAFVAKLDENGTGLWAKQGGSSLNERDQGDSIDVDAHGDIYVTGRFQESADIFGQSVLGESREDVFIVKMHDDGTIVWLKHFSDNSAIYSEDIIVSGDNVYTIGSFYGDISVDAQSIITHGGYDIYFAELNASNGSIINLEAQGNSTWDFGEAIGVSENGFVYTTGKFKEILTLYNTDLTSYGCYDIFVGQHLRVIPVQESVVTMPVSVLMYLLL